MAAVRALRAGGYRSAVTVAPATSRAAISRYSERRVEVPHVSESGYVAAVRSELSRSAYLTVLPASEAAMRALECPGLHLTDKANLEEAAKDAGIDVPESHTFAAWSDVLSHSDEFRYPLVVKPVVRTFSPVHVDGAAQLSNLKVEGGDILVQEWLEDGLRAVSGVMWQGQLIAATFERWLRIWPVPCGLASAAVTTTPEPSLENKMTRLLHDYEGIFCAQFAGSRLIDLNLRVYSSLSLSVAAGNNLVSLYCDLLNGFPVSQTRAAPGHYYRWLEGDLRHVARAWRRRTMTARDALAALRPRRGAAHSIESLRDPAPLVARLLYAGGRAHLSGEQRKRGTLRRP